MNASFNSTEDIMKPATPKAPKTNRTAAAISDLAPKSDQQVRGGAPRLSEIVVTKDQDCSSSGLL